MASREPLGEGGDQRVAGFVAERVVHQLEVVEVERDHRDALARALRPPQGELQELVEHRAVGEVRELVVVGEERDLLLGRLAFGDVQHHALDEERVRPSASVSTTALSRNQTTRPSRAISRYSRKNGSPESRPRS